MTKKNRTWGATVSSMVLVISFCWLAGARRASTAPKEPVASGSPASVTVCVVLQGPWAIMQDPANSKQLVAMSPYLADHTLLYVKDLGSGTVLNPGIYTLTVPEQGALMQSFPPPITLKRNIPMADYQSALGNKGNRYAVYFPMPAAKSFTQGQYSKVSEAWPVDPSTNQSSYSTEIDLVYPVSDLTGFSIAGTDDQGGSPKPYAITIPAVLPAVYIGTQPKTQDTGNAAYCSVESKHGFHELVGLFSSLKEFVDFPTYDGCCKSSDPQATAPQPPCTSARLDATLAAIRDYLGKLRGTTPKESNELLAAVARLKSQLGAGGTRKMLDRHQLAKDLQTIRTFLHGQGRAGAESVESNLVARLDSDVTIFNLPVTDCKTPHIELTVQ